MENQGFIMTFIGKLEVSAVGIDCISEVRPERKVFCRKETLSLDGCEPAAAVQAEHLKAEEGAHCPRKQSRDGDRQAPEREDGKSKSSSCLLGRLHTTKASSPTTALPVTANCSRLRFSAWILWRSCSSRYPS